MLRRSLWALWAVAMAIISAGGCGNGDFGQDARVPVSERHILSAGTPAGASLRLPEDRGYNIHVKQNSENKGAFGQATSRSDATPQGTALASVEVGNGATAKAEFKIGHRIDNSSPDIQNLTAEISFDLRQVVSASEVPAPATLSEAHLVLLVVDSHKRTVSKTTLVDATSDHAAGKASMPQTRHITARLEAGESYDIALYGTVEASSDQQQCSAANLELKDLKMFLTFAPAPPQAASDPACP